MVDTESIGLWLIHVLSIEEKDLIVPFVAAYIKELVSSSNFVTKPQLLEVERFQDSSEVSLDFPGTLCFQRFIVSRINSN